VKYILRISGDCATKYSDRWASSLTVFGVQRVVVHDEICVTGRSDVTRDLKFQAKRNDISFQSLSQGNTLLSPPNGGGIKFRKIMSMSAIHT
jgi:hypothetical protein